MGDKDLDFDCKENEDGSLTCVANDDEGECQMIRVPDGRGGWKLKQQAGNPKTCDALEDEVVSKRT